jgi:hypothetical protein
MVEMEHANKTLVVVSESKRPLGVPRRKLGTFNGSQVKTFEWFAVDLSGSDRLL